MVDCHTWHESGGNKPNQIAQKKSCRSRHEIFVFKCGRLNLGQILCTKTTNQAAMPIESTKFSPTNVSLDLDTDVENTVGQKWCPCIGAFVPLLFDNSTAHLTTNWINCSKWKTSANKPIAAKTSASADYGTDGCARQWWQHPNINTASFWPTSRKASVRSNACMQKLWIADITANILWHTKGWCEKRNMFLLDRGPAHVCFTPNTSWLKNAEKDV